MTPDCCICSIYILLLIILIIDSIFLGLHSSKGCSITIADGEEGAYEVHCPDTFQFQCPGPYSALRDSLSYSCPFEHTQITLGALSIALIVVEGIARLLTKAYEQSDKIRCFLFIQLCISVALIFLCSITSGLMFNSLKSVDISTVSGASQGSYYGCPIMFLITGIVCFFNLTGFMMDKGDQLIPRRVTYK